MTQGMIRTRNTHTHLVRNTWDRFSDGRFRGQGSPVSRGYYQVKKGKPKTDGECGQ